MSPALCLYKGKGKGSV